jgi:CubicO group peptidase (beta-lactamase class C family)
VQVPKLATKVPKLQLRVWKWFQSGPVKKQTLSCKYYTIAHMWMRGFIFFLVCFYSSAFAQNSIDQKLENFSLYADQARINWHVPGMAIAIIKDNKVIYAKGFGVRDLQNNPVTPETIFNIGSITKSFTAALLALLIDGNKFSWGTKIVDLYPHFKLYDPTTTRNFAVRDLMTHDSGLPAYTGEMQILLGFSADHVINSWQFIKPIAKFRSQFAYQSSFSLIAQKIIEKYSGKSYPAALHDLLFSPLGMNDSTTTLDIVKSTNIAAPFIYKDSKLSNIPNDWPYFYWEKNYVATEGIKSNVLDMAKWLIFQLSNGEINKKPIIHAKTMQFMQSPQTIIMKSSKGKIINASGEGWFVESDYLPLPMIWHTGDVSGMNAAVAFVPKANIGIVVLTNSRPSGLPEALLRKFFDLYFDLPPTDWSKKKLTEMQNADQKNKTQALHCDAYQHHDLKNYAGIYYNDVYGKVTVINKDDYLLLTIGPKSLQWKLFPCKPDIFQLYWPGLSQIAPESFIDNLRSVKFSTQKDLSKVMVIDLLNHFDRAGIFKPQGSFATLG